MARWKARIRLPIRHKWTFSLALTAEALQGKSVKTRWYQKGVGQCLPRFEGGWVVPGEYFLVSTKLDAFCYLTVQTAPCYVQSFWHNTGVWQTDARTDGSAVASTALAMRALRRAVKTDYWVYPMHSIDNTSFRLYDILQHTLMYANCQASTTVQLLHNSNISSRRKRLDYSDMTFAVSRGQLKLRHFRPYGTSY